jgi:DNA processing protein
MFDSYAMTVDAHERAAVLALTKAATEAGVKWHRVATIVEQADSALRVLKRDWSGFEVFDLREAERLAETVSRQMLDEAETMILAAEDQGDRVLTVLDTGYPANLRRIFNRPPFLFVRGQLNDQDQRAVAIVGTRTPSDEGIQQAGHLAEKLAGNGVTVLSGLAKGIDGAAHRAALDARGRTVAVMGTGINRLYPSANADLAERILTQRGALVSQFWPDAPPTRSSFPMRNVVMSGLAIGTVVIEASSTSGAKMQARLALEHGKQVFLVESLVLQESWAQRYVERGARVVRSVDDILETLVLMAQPARQLALG